ncbi:DUF440 family protein [Pseudoalteromonas sp.]|uniref:DUF440 family protein n=1 Tax=Pseudoalteromonas sp. TaxID=53249 RepID=UPI003568FC4F
MTQEDHLWTIEEVTNHAYEVFLELAPDNLSEQDIIEFNKYREDLGFIEESEPDESWHEFTEFEIEPELYVQVLVGLEFDNQDVLFARILISRDKAAPFVHVLWK